MDKLINHILRISPRRDRTEINAAMVDALMDFFHPRRLSIYRCYANSRGTILFSCAGYGEHGYFLHNAYLPNLLLCQPLDKDPLHQKCVNAKTAVMELLADGSHRIVFPVFREEYPAYLIDLSLSEDLSPDQRVTMMGLVEYFANHIALLDYGETDTLTGLASRKTFDKHLFELLGHPAEDPLDSAVSRRRRETASSHWLAVCDVDHFKLVNDSYGHLVGDHVLVALAETMRSSFRFDDQLFRFGGEEFIILLQPTTEESALLALERFRKQVETQNFPQVGHITISIGFGALRPSDSPSRAIDRADEALYYAKRHGRNRVDGYEQLVSCGQLSPHHSPTAPALATSGTPL